MMAVAAAGVMLVVAVVLVVLALVFFLVSTILALRKVVGRRGPGGREPRAALQRGRQAGAGQLRHVAVRDQRRGQGGRGDRLRRRGGLQQRGPERSRG